MMALRSNSGVTLIAAALGLVVPLLCYAIVWFTGPAGGWILIAWPSSIMTMAIFHPGIVAVVGVSVSVLINIALYAAIGRLLSPLILRLARH